MASSFFTLFSLFLTIPSIFTVLIVENAEDGSIRDNFLKNKNMDAPQENAQILHHLKEKIKSKELANWLSEPKTLEWIHQSVCHFSTGPNNGQKIEGTFKIDSQREIRIESGHHGKNDGGKLVEELGAKMGEICNFKKGNEAKYAELQRQIPDLLAKVIRQSGHSMMAQLDSVKIVFMQKGKEIGGKKSVEGILAETEQKAMKAHENASQLMPIKKPFQDLREIFTLIANEMEEGNAVKKLLNGILANKEEAPILPGELLKLANQIFIQDFVGKLFGAKLKEKTPKLAQNHLHHIQNSNKYFAQNHPIIAATARRRRRRRHQNGGNQGGNNNQVPFNMSQGSFNLAIIAAIVGILFFSQNLFQWGVVMPFQAGMEVGGHALNFGGSIGELLGTIFGLMFRHPLICLCAALWLYVSHFGPMPANIERFFRGDDAGGSGHGGGAGGGGAIPMNPMN